MRIAFAALALAVATTTLDAQVYDRVILGGRVMDPASGLDATRNVGIRGNRIAMITASPIAGRDTLEAKGLVVAPGFIDLHQHWQEPDGYRFEAQDGVTTALELEGGAYPIVEWYKEREGKAAINFGASASHGGIRHAALSDTSELTVSLSSAKSAQDTLAIRNPGVYRTANPAQLSRIVQLTERALADGAIGIGFGINYTPAAGRDEIFRLFQLGAKQKVPSFVHVRSSGPSVNGGSIDAMQEVIADAAITGASLHIVHVTSSSARLTPLVLEMIHSAKARGVDVTTELYPYEAASTHLESAIFDEGWQRRMQIDYKDLLWPATGERLTAETFAKYRAQGGWVVIFVIPAEAMRTALVDSTVLIASDGVPLIDGKGHPRGVGTNARVLGRYVREEKLLTLMQAIRKMTLMPARRLEASVPQMKNKGRLKVGADADVTVFDPQTVIDRATFEQPAQASAGIAHVLVNGTPVVRKGELVAGAAPGVAIRRK